MGKAGAKRSGVPASEGQGGESLSLEKLPVISLGSSHGGYLALLTAKLAPGHIHTVIENSAYTKANYNYVLGKELDYLKYSETVDVMDHFIMKCYTQTHWTSNKYSPNCFTPAAMQIRDLAQHLGAWEFARPRIVSYHSAQDHIAPAEDKRALIAAYRGAGLEVEYTELSKASQLDGAFLKDLTHGMGMSLKKLAQRELPPALAWLEKHPPKRPGTGPFIYPCEGADYVFSLKNEGVELKIKRTGQ